MSSFCQRKPFVPPHLVEAVVGALGAVLLLCAIMCRQGWLDAHFLPAFFLSRSGYVLLEDLGRVVVAALGVTLAIFARRRLANFLAYNPARAFAMAIAVVLAFVASELVLRQIHLRASAEEPPNIEPHRRYDSRLGWAFVPSRTGKQFIGGRVIEYTFDAAGYRVRNDDQVVDPESPTIVFAGESMMVGEGLTWDESIPAQVGSILGIQSANIAVSGFATDQTYLRLQTELRRFAHPIAVVSLFSPDLFDRNLDDDRPHLGPGLVWLPPVPRSRLLTIAKFLVPFRSTETVERGITVTQEVLHATIESAHARGVEAFIVVPQFLPEESIERHLRQRILDQDGIPYLWVELDPHWRIPGDDHPDARAPHKIAVAIADRLREHQTPATLSGAKLQ